MAYSCLWSAGWCSSAFPVGKSKEKRGLSGSHSESFSFASTVSALRCGVLGWTAMFAWSQPPASKPPLAVSHLCVVGGLAEVNQFVCRA